MTAEIGGDIASLIKKARAERGISQPQLARLVGTSQQTIDKIENGRVKRSSYLAAIAVELGVSLDRVLRIRHNNGGVSAIPGHRLVTDQRDLPVYAVTHRGDGVNVLSVEPVEYVLRPEPLARVRDAYSVTVSDDLMAPEVQADDVALINPHIQPRPGDTCLFRSHHDGKEYEVCLKRLRKVTDKDWHVLEWGGENGDKREFVLKRSTWTIAHVVIGYFKRR